MANTVKLQIRRDTAAAWTSANPSMLLGEIGFETDTRKVKIGTSANIDWTTLDYVVAEPTAHTHTESEITDLGTIAVAVTAPWTFTTPAFQISALGNISGTAALNLANGCFFTCTVTGAVTLSVTGTLTGISAKNLAVVIVNGGTNITWSSVFKFPAGEAPTLTIEGTDIITFVTINNGTTWLNMGQVLDVK
jgi:hypothetical protein